MESEGVPHFEMCERDALYPLPGRELTDIPVRIDHHKKGASIGRVRCGLASARYYQAQRRSTMQLLWPPNPKELETPIST